MTKTEMMFICKVIAEVERSWEQRHRNLQVQAKAEPGAWTTTPATARRLADQLERKLKKLRRLDSKLQHEFVAR